jgi:hypothetical protein
VVHIGILIDADCDHRDLWHTFLHFEQAGELFDAGSAIRCPKVQHYNAPTQLAKVNGSGAVIQDELRGSLADAAGMISSVAARYQQHT